MKISIVVPVYNAEKYLDDCIMSVVNQTNKNWELVLVNDGSTDNSREICNMYAQKYNSKISVYHKENEGQFLTRQYGIQKSSGKYVGFLDADDILDKEYIGKIIYSIEHFNYPDVICFGFYNKGNNCQQNVSAINDYRLFVTLEERHIVYEQIIEGKLVGSMCTKVFKKEKMLKKDNISDVINSRYGEDAYQSYDIIYNAESILYMNEIMYFYRDNVEGASQGYKEKDLHYFNTKYVAELIKENLKNMQLDNFDNKEKLYARNFNETVYHILNYYRQASDIKRKCEIIKYDWNTYLLEDFDKIKDNKYVRKSYIKVWNAFKNKRYWEIFFREIFIGW